MLRIHSRGGSANALNGYETRAAIKNLLLKPKSRRVHVFRGKMW